MLRTLNTNCVFIRFCTVFASMDFCTKFSIYLDVYTMLYRNYMLLFEYPVLIPNYVPTA